MQTILACVDFSDVESGVVAAATALARAFKGDLHVLHVGDPDPAFVGFAVGPQTVRDQVAKTLDEQHRHVEVIANAATEQGLRAHPHTRRGPFVDTILSEAKRLHIDVIVVGSHGHGPMHTLLVGGVAAGVLRGAKVPVLVVPHPKISA